MAWIQHLVYFLVFSFGLLLTQLLRLKYSPRDAVWAKLDAVGASPQHSPPLFVRGVISSILSTQKFANEGYRKFSKALDRAYALPTPWVRGSTVMVLPPSQISLLTRPDRTDGGEWTNMLGLIETAQLPHVIDDPNVYQNLIHFEVVRRKMAHKDMSRLAPETADEIDQAFSDIWGTKTEWSTVNGWVACGQVISRAAQRILVGLPESRDKRMLETSRHYANALLVGGAIINCFPPAVRWLVAPVITIRARYYQARYVKIMRPLIEERIRQWEADKEGGPDDFLQWMIPMCAKDPDQLDATRIALRLASLVIPLIFAICYMFAHCVFDIHGSPCRVEVLAGLEEECRRVSAQHPSLNTSVSVDALVRVDSTLRESMRISDVSVTNIFRDVTAGEVEVVGGLRVGPGVRMVFPTQDIHLDPDNYEDPRRFDAFRFSRPFEDSNDHKKEGRQDFITTTTPSFLPFSYGRHACPGRWFAAQLMKQALAYIVLNYDVELVGPQKKRKALLNMMLPPVGTQIRIRRKV
ncbi:putative cytochrome P450 [Rosellinia necatrix]|uniref:Putative cytochrome P450 n=1 Tax=Rosellinia necatrix TaxID=77044 RepID=A0A1W2TSG9_ROSNE|nr:putative cytochrome P450 [Rosellinia necatrix]